MDCDIERVVATARVERFGKINDQSKRVITLRHGCCEIDVTFCVATRTMHDKPDRRICRAKTLCPVIVHRQLVAVCCRETELAKSRCRYVAGIDDELRRRCGICPGIGAATRDQEYDDMQRSHR